MKSHCFYKPLAMLLLGICTLSAQSAVPALNAPAATTSRPAITTPLAADALAAELDHRFAIWFVGQPLPPQTSLTLPATATPNDALALLQNALKTANYQLTEVPGSNREVFQLTAPNAQPQPYHYGADPDQIPISEDRITQIIPLKNIAVRVLKSDVTPLLSPDASIAAEAHNTLIITDTANKIHRLAAILQQFDSHPYPPTSVEYRQLLHANAADVARLINAMFDPRGTQHPNATQPATTPPPVGRLYADSDPRTNTVVLNGPADQIKQALEMIAKIDAAAATNPATATAPSTSPK